MIGNDGKLLFNNTGDQTSEALIQGSGDVIKSGTNKLTLLGLSGYTGQTFVNSGTLELRGREESSGYAIATGATLNFNAIININFRNSGTTTFTGGGTLRKTSDSALLWTARHAVFAMDAGSLIDVAQGQFSGLNGSEDWTQNRSALHVGAFGSFDNGGANVRVDALTGEGRITSGSSDAGYAGFTVGVANGSGTYSGTLADAGADAAGKFIKVGTGTQTLNGASTYTGGTVITAGTLIVANSSAVGTGLVDVKGGVLLVDTGAGIGNAVRLSGGSYNRHLSAGASLAHAVDSSSALGADPVSASILQGSMSADGTLQSHFAQASGASNDEIRLSDVYAFSGVSVIDGTTGETDVFVLQLSLDSAAADSFLGWLDPETNTWVNAVEGNFGGAPTFVLGAYDPDTDFHLGYYGVDTATGSVWAVLNHNSDFAVVPEPSAGILLVFGAAAVMLAARRKVH